MITKAFLIKEYLKNKKSPYQIAKETNYTYGQLLGSLRKYKIKSRNKSEAQKYAPPMTQETRQKISKSHKGKRLGNKNPNFGNGIKISGNKNPNWAGGKFKRADGYIAVLKKTHPFANQTGYIMEHRLVVETQIGRFLLPYEQVHHLNKLRHDNRPENLMAFSNQSAHRRFELGGKFKLEEIIFDGRKLK